MKKIKICVVTTSRADYGSMRCLMREIKNDRDLKLQLVVTGMHLLPEFGSTYKEILKDGFAIDHKVEMLISSDRQEDIVKSIGQGCIIFADVFKKLKPDWVVLFGDRFELLSGAITAMIEYIPIAHISGGEVTEGMIDDHVRHAITKMANVHFPAAEAYRKRIIQLGENPAYIFNYGHLGLDNIFQMRLLNTKELQRELNFEFTLSTAIATYHPETIGGRRTASQQIDNLLNAIKKTDINVVFTKANCDFDGRLINQRIQEFCVKNPARYRFFDNLGQLRYLSCLKNFDLMIGNSSSGMFEAPALGIPVVNIGDRQKGRLRSENILDVGYSEKEIKAGINTVLSAGFKQQLKNIDNPYGKSRSGSVGFRIKEKLKRLAGVDAIIKKKFFDVKF